MNARWALAWLLVPLVRGAAPDVVPEVRPFALENVRLLPGPFRDAQERDARFLLSLDPDRLLVMFRSTAGLYAFPRYVAPYGGWESPASGVRGHTMGHYLSACSLMYAATGDPRFKARTDYLVAELAKCQAALAENGSHPGYLSAFPEFFFDRVDARKPIWAPWYTMHKIMAGLLEAYVHTGNVQALEVDNRLAAWVKFRVDRLSVVQMQRSLQTEHGGMTEVLANLYAVTGNPEDLRLARAFNHHAIIDPLARGEDRLDGLHANTQFPKIIGAAREYELTGDALYRAIAENFWRDVALRRSYAIGGDSDDEHFFPVDAFPAHLTAVTCETCNVYNLLKLTEHVFAWRPRAATMDFYERGLYNQILASQDPDTGMMTYFVPLQSGRFKTYSTPENSFWCCVGTGMENHAKYGEEIYARQDRVLYVNLFIPSELQWKEQGLRLRQDTQFPDEPETRLTLEQAGPGPFTIKIRQPGWCPAPITVTVNGEPAAASPDDTGYLALNRVWQAGDAVRIHLPMALRTEPLPGAPATVAVFDGPIVLAGRLGAQGLPGDGQEEEQEKDLVHVPVPPTPRLEATPGALLAALQPSPADGPLAFRTVGIGRPREVTLIPFYRLHHERFAIYWQTASPAPPRRADE